MDRKKQMNSKTIISLTLVCLFAVVLIAVAVVPPVTAKRTYGSNAYGAYKHVFIIGIDGAGGSAFSRFDTPNFDRIFADGAVSHKVRTEVLSDSGPNWASILTGVSYFKHYIHNGSSGEKQRDSSTKYPTVFGVVRNAKPDAELASFVNWNNVNFGMVETDINVTEHQNDDDNALTDAICAYFDAGNAPAVFFVQIDLVDAAGHGYGSDAPEYIAAMKTADAYIGRIYDCLDRNGLLEDGLFIVTADHGHKIAGGHGRFSMRESTTTIAAVGKTVVSGGTLDKTTRDRDIAAITLFALGVEKPSGMSARVPAGLFQNTPGEARSFYKDPLDGIISPVMWLVTLLTPQH